MLSAPAKSSIYLGLGYQITARREGVLIVTEPADRRVAGADRSATSVHTNTASYKEPSDAERLEYPPFMNYKGDEEPRAPCYLRGNGGRSTPLLGEPLGVASGSPFSGDLAIPLVVRGCSDFDSRKATALIKYFV